MTTQCLIAGGGPAGMMLGLLLARAGVSVVVLEKHSDFFRDFRGDTIHPSTLEIMEEIGLLEELLSLPHQKAFVIRGQIGEMSLALADFSHLPVTSKFIAFMPQWDFLNFLAGRARAYDNFRLEMDATVIGLLYDGDTVRGVRITSPTGERELRADLVVGADGRSSDVREAAGLEPIDFGAPMDVLWMRLSRKPTDPKQLFGRIDFGRIFVMIDRGDYWQCALVIRKGAFEGIRTRGIEALRADILQMNPFLSDRVPELRDWNDIKLLTVQVNRLRKWFRPGLLCIGDAAHAMSPVAGVGINLAIQDAVAAANILIPAFQRGGKISVDTLKKVQDRRELPTRVVQRVQLAIQNNIITRVLDRTGRMKPPLAVRALAYVPLLRRIPARLIGLGFRREHVDRSLRTRANGSASSR
ncbi:MAG TPA: FAD-dependent oxidoreductase [Gemmatimonadaceae bacterium]|nr:FAD-dependent oxidoreductase [Gemmatimonadaceae bacterium]